MRTPTSCLATMLRLLVLLLAGLPAVAKNPATEHLVGRDAQRSGEIALILQPKVEELVATGGACCDGLELASTKLLPALYQRRGFFPLWHDVAAEQLLEAVRGADRHGLDPADYHFEALDARLASLPRRGKKRSEELAEIDLLLTDSLVRISYHLRFGKVDPEALDPNWNIVLSLGQEDPVGAMLGAIASDELGPRIEALAPQHWMYRGYMEELARYRAFAAAGGWEPVDEGPTLTAGDAGPRVAQLRARLEASGHLPVSPGADVFDDALKAAVEAFQGHHGLYVDGVVGKNTLAALNVPVEHRVDQLRVNLERGRWLLHDFDQDFVGVNIAGFEAWVVEGGRITWRTRAQVGAPYRQTPVFRADMTHLVVNPTWTLPPTILLQDVLPLLREDLGVLAERGLEVLDPRGDLVDPSTVDWEAFPQEPPYPYALRQGPGPSNPLGRMKFMFPNEHYVYLHDTPRQTLFGRDQRAVSSGCIRIEDPLALAAWVLRSQERWNRPALEAAIEAGDTREIRLDEPVPVVLAYLTAWVEDDGVQFRQDPYARDARILEGLRGPFRFRERPILDEVDEVDGTEPE